MESMDITGAVGKWHLAAHIPECFSKFSLNFVEGAGQVEGEILETLWSGLDEVSGLAQSMSIAHHQEVIDAYMNDSNWRKIVRTGGKMMNQSLLCFADIRDSWLIVWKMVQSREGSFRHAASI